MRAFENQQSDNRPIRRSHSDKQRQLQLLRERLAVMPARAQDTTRDALKAKIAELQRELGDGTRS